MKQLLVLLSFFCIGVTAQAQNGAVISTDELIYNFGTIAEEEGLATHVFVVKNTGNGPLVINRVTASCGCTRPEWSKEPIAPGKTSKLKVSYDPTGRPGPFIKMISIYSNGKKGPYNLTIKGTVLSRPLADNTFPYAIGELKLYTKSVLFSSIIPGQTSGERIQVYNSGKEELQIHVSKHSSFLMGECKPGTLKPGEAGEITLLFDGNGVKNPGRYSFPITITAYNKKNKASKGTVQVSANVVDDFTKLSATDKANAPQVQLSSTVIDYGKLDNDKGKVSQKLKITNIGKTPLIIHSVTTENNQLTIQGGKKDLKPGATATYTVSIRPKEIKAKLEAYITIVCNDPRGPVRLIKVTASY